jgi:hypothetical protein
MDISELKKIAELSYDAALAKRNALEKAQSRMLMGYEGHLFRADAATICVVRTMMEKNSSFFMLDSNGNPCEIKRPQDLLDRLIARNQESINTYHQTYTTISQKG